MSDPYDGHPESHAGEDGGPVDVTTLLDTLESMAAEQDELRARLEAMEASAPVRHAAGDLDDPPSVDERLDPATLGAWVGWLCETYALEDKIPETWREIPGVARELAALRAAYVVAYDDKDQLLAGFDPVQWHDALQRVLGRIREVWRQSDKRRSGGYTASQLPRRTSPGLPPGSSAVSPAP